MFYRDERYKEIIVIITPEVVDHNYLTILDLEVYSHVKYYDDDLGLNIKALHARIDSDEQSILKSMVNLSKAGLVDIKEYNNLMYCNIRDHI